MVLVHDAGDAGSPAKSGETLEKSDA
jgi:hypothetical protein